MAVTDVKFSNFADGGDLEVADIVVGLRNGVNTRFNYTASPGLYLPLAGGTMAGTIDMDGFSITGLPAPTLPSDAVPYSSLTALGTPSPLTRVDDTNVTLTLGGTPATALLQSVSLTMGWTGQLSVSRGGTGNSTFTAYSLICAGTTATGAFQNVLGVGSLNQVLVSQGAGALPIWSSVPGVVPAAMTRVDDTNVTLTLGGTPSTSLLQAVSLTLGWTGELGLTRGGTNANLTASNGGIVYSTATAMAILSGTATAGQILRSGSSAAPTWSTATYPATAGTSGNVLTSDGTNWVSSVAAASTGFESSLLLMGG